jgi:4,5-DOPA dioxygenase extradiol
MEKMPVLFVGHGSPMNAIEENIFTKNWEKIARDIPRPEAILSVSAHWYTEGTRINDGKRPQMVYDMYGFPEELYRVVYGAEGAPELAHETQRLIKREVALDNTWGLDHGTWSVLVRMYPKADIPVYQLSVDALSGPEAHFQMGREISALREQGVLILGSGNVVHNLHRLSWDMDGGYPWAVEFDDYVKTKILSGQFGDIINYRSAGTSAELAFPSPDHFYPLLYILGASSENGRVSVYNEQCVMGSMSMTCYLMQ